jgi:hypothetical protein
MRLADRLPVAVLSLGVALALVCWVTIEWEYPYCHDPNPEDGPAVGVVGVPLPYAAYSGCCSLTYLFAPHLFAIDVGLVAAAVWVWLHCLGVRGRSLWSRRLAASIGTVLVTLHAALVTLFLAWGVYWPRASIANYTFTYAELRPLRLGTRWPSRCEP